MEIFFTRILANYADTIIAHCDSAKSEIATLFKVEDRNKIVVVPHGNFTNLYPNSTSRQQARAQLGVQTGDFVFLYLGLVRPYKGVDELIESFCKLNLPGTILIVAGKAPDAEFARYIAEKAKESEGIRLALKFVPDNQIQVYMNSADVVVLPFQDILTSGTLILAMSFGKPVIVPCLGCVSDTIDEAGGFLYDPNEAGGLSRAIKQSFESRQELIQMGEHNYRVAERWDWQHIAEDTNQIYKLCLANSESSELNASKLMKRY